MNELSTTETIRRTCPTCEACCGLIVEVDRTNNSIVSIKGDPDDTRSQGYVCAKSQVFNHVYEDPQRLRQPVLKTAEGWQPIGWNEALAMVANKFRGIIEAHGKDALGIYVGNPLGHDFAAGIYLQSLMAVVNTERFFSAGTVDQHPQQLVCWGLLGHEWLFPVPDLHRTDLFICMGANPVVSQGSILGTPDIEKTLRDLQERGGRCVVIDPRHSETAALADQHIFIRPGTDAWFLLSFAHVLVEQKAVDTGHVADNIDNLNAFIELVQDFPPEKTASVTGVDAAALRELAVRYAQTNRAALYGRIGLCTQEFGLVSHWLLMVISLISGKFDTAGGMMMATAPTGGSGPGVTGEVKPYGRWKSRKSGVPETCGELPASLLTEEITASGEEIRGLLTICGNPVLSVPGGRQLRDALSSVDFIVSLDIYINETTSCADLILPSSVHPEHSNIDVTFQNFATRNFASYSPRLLEPEAGVRDLGDIILDIAARLSGLEAAQMDEFILAGMIDTVVKRGEDSGYQLSAERIRDQCDGDTSAETYADLMMRSGPYGDWFGAEPDGLSLASLKVHPQATIDLGALQQRLPGILRTPGQRIDLMHELFTLDLPRLNKRFEELLAQDSSDKGKMLLVGRRHIRDMNSWLHNLRAYVRGRNRCTLKIHPDDARALYLQEGVLAAVRGEAGTVELPVEVTAEMMPGVVSIPHGFGHLYEGCEQDIAAASAGVSCNDIIGTGLDIASSTCVVNGVPVTVCRA